MTRIPLERPAKGSPARGTTRERDLQNLERIQAARALKPPPRQPIPERSIAAATDARRALK